MKPQFLFLCLKCANASVVDLVKVIDEPSVPLTPPQQKCDGCGKKVYGTFYRIKKRGE